MKEKIRILYIDDNPLDRALVRDSLEKEHGGFQLTEAKSREEFERLILKPDYDLVLTDFNIMGFDAIQVLAFIKDNNPEIPVIVITGTGSERVAIETMKGGAWDYVIKTTQHIKRLPQTIESVLEKKRQIDLRKESEEKLFTSETRYRRLFEAAKDGILIIDASSGLIIDCNPFLSQLLGFSQQELIGKELWEIGTFNNISASKEAFNELVKKEYIRFEDLPLLTKDGKTIEVEFVSNMYLVNSSKIIQCNIRDITERKQAEQQQNLFAKALEILNRPNDWQTLINDILCEIKSFTGFDAVGIRLREGHDFPYFYNNGFSEDFIKQENFLCVRNKDGSIATGPDGLPLHECTCGVVVSGNIDKSKPYFTEGGSFWTNQSTDLLKLLPEEDPRTNPRNRCIHSGYMSVALVPIQAGNEIVGLLQLNDNQSNRFSLEMIHFFERVATSIGIAYSRIKTEERIKHSEEKYRNLVDNALIGVYKTTLDGNITFGNDAMLRIMEFEYYNYTELNVKDFYKNANDRIKFIQAIQEKGEIKNFELELISKKGNLRNVILSGRVEGNEISGMMLDISDRKRAEEALRQSEMKYYTLFQHAPIGYQSLNNDGIILDVNDMWLNSLGYSREEVIGKWFGDFLHPEQKDIFSRLFPENIKTNDIIRDVEYHLVRKNGTIVIANYSASIGRDEKGNFIRTHCIFQDVTERKLAEETLIKTLEKLELASKSARLGIWDWDIINNKLDWDDRMYELYGINRNDFSGAYEAWLAGIHPDDREASNELSLKAQRGEIEYNTEFRVVWPNGSVHHLKAYGIFERDSKGKPFRMTGVNFDITDLKRTEEALKKSEALLASAMEMAHLGHWENDIINDKFTFNDLFYKIFKTDVEHVGGYEMSSAEYASRFLHPDDLYMVAEENKKAIESTDPNFSRQLEHRIIYADGSVGYISVKFFIVKDEHGRTIKSYGVNQDITERKKAEEALRESELRFKQVSDNANEWIWEVDKYGLYTYSSPIIKEILGYEPEEIVGKKHFYDLINPADREQMKKWAFEVFERRDNFNGLLNCNIHKNGNKVFLSTSGVPRIDNDGNLIGYRGVDIDITKRKQSEEALLESEEKYRQLVELSPDAIIIHKNGIVVFTNEAALKMMGFDKKEDLIGKKALDFVHPDYREAALERIRHIITKGVKAPVYEEKFIKKDGSVLDVEVSAIPFQFENETAVQVIIRDITERKETEKALIESEERYSTIVSNSPNIILIHQGGYIQYINNFGEALLGYTKEDTIGKSVLDFLTEESKPVVITNMQRRAEGKNVPAYEANICTKTGDIKTVLVQSTLIPFQKAKAFLVVLTDITMIKEFEKELQEAKEIAEESSRLKSSFLANMSHELRTPMNGILGFSNILTTEEDIDAVHEYSKLVNISAKRLMETLNLILNISRIEAGEMKLTLKNADAMEIISAAVELFRVNAEEKGLSLNLKSDYRALRLKTDEQALSSVINNLINNAVKYTEEGSVTVIVEKEITESQDWFVIKVVDTGIGIDEADLEVIYQEFRQASEGLGRSFEGTGLGLTLTKKFVSLLEGVINVESIVGKGSTFIVKLPMEKRMHKLLVPTVKDVGNLMENIERELMESNSSVLLVEDDEVAILLVKRFMKDLIDIDTVKNSRDAIAKAKEKSYSLILMDINLGRSENGLWAAQEIRKLPEYSDIPIAAFTAYAMKSEKEKFLNEGCSHYISKPFTREELVKTIYDALSGKKYEIN